MVCFTVEESVKDLSVCVIDVHRQAVAHCLLDHTPRHLHLIQFQYAGVPEYGRALVIS